MRRPSDPWRGWVVSCSPPFRGLGGFLLSGAKQIGERAERVKRCLRSGSWLILNNCEYAVLPFFWRLDDVLRILRILWISCSDLAGSRVCSRKNSVTRLLYRQRRT